MIEISPLAVGAIGIIVLMVLLFAGMPVGFAMALIGLAGFAYLRSIEPAVGILAQIPFKTFSNYNWSVIPLFMFMGMLLVRAGITEDLYQTAHRWVGHVRGGLAMATSVACAAFGAVSGSSTAMVVGMGTVALPEMLKYKYAQSLATGVIAASGTIASMIPPSVGLIIYGIITEQSIGKLFLAGIIPGILQTVFYIITIAAGCRRDPRWGPPGPTTSFAEKLKALRYTWIVLALFILVMGGIYLGVFTPTEAGGVGAFGAFLFAIGRRRLSWKGFWESLRDAVALGGLTFMILLGAKILNTFLAMSRLPYELGILVSSLEVNRFIVLAAVMILYLILGCLMDFMSVILLTLPIIFPAIAALGFDPIWFGILINLMGETGVVTPPVGINVFVMAAVAPDIPMYTIFRGIIPFVVANIILLVILVAFPQISLIIPNSMMA